MIYAKANIISLRSYAQHFAKAKFTLLAISIDLFNLIQSLNLYTNSEQNF